MTLALIQAKTSDYGKMRPMFDSFEAKRLAAGLTNPRVYRNNEDGNELVILPDAASVEKARAFFSTQELRTEMKQGGALGPPKTSAPNLLI